MSPQDVLINPESLSLDEIVIKDNKNRFFRTWATVEVRDSQGEIIPISKFKETMLILLKRGAPLTIKHTNKIVGRLLNCEFVFNDIHNKEGAIVTGEIFNDWRLDNDTWQKLQDKYYTGVSVGGQQAQADSNGKVEWIEPCEFALTESPANRQAIMTAVAMAKDIPIGKHNNIPDDQFDKTQLEDGMKVEAEHSDNSEYQKAIAKDHLMESKDYYIKLKQMEATFTEKSETDRVINTDDNKKGSDKMTTEIKKEEEKIVEVKPEPQQEIQETPVDKPVEKPIVKPEEQIVEKENKVEETQVAQLEEDKEIKPEEIIEEKASELSEIKLMLQKVIELLSASAQPKEAMEIMEAPMEKEMKKEETAAVADLKKSLETVSTPRPESAVQYEPQMEAKKINDPVEIAHGRQKFDIKEFVKRKE